MGLISWTQDTPDNEYEKKTGSLTSTASSGRSARVCCRTCSRWSPGSASPCSPGSGSARCKAPCRLAASPRAPSCRSGLTVAPRSSTSNREVHCLLFCRNARRDISAFPGNAAIALLSFIVDLYKWSVIMKVGNGKYKCEDMKMLADIPVARLGLHLGLLTTSADEFV